MDVWDKECYQKRVNQTPKGKTFLDPINEQGDKNYHVMRGGSWVSSVDFLSTAFREWDHDNWRWYPIQGFRVAVPCTRSD